MTTDRVLVTGACGLVGESVVRRLVDEGHEVVATDLDVPKNRRRVRRFPRSDRLQVQWADLTVEDAASKLVVDVDPRAIVHLAAVIPPACYARRDVARRVSVGATRALVAAAAGRPDPPRFVLASSVAVYGARNPHRHSGLLTADTALRPCDLYGGHKVEAERAVSSSDLEWVILRLGGVMTPSPRSDGGLDMVAFEGLLPADGRIQTVDVRDVAVAFCRAVTVDVAREAFLVGGDSSHRVLQGTLGSALSDAMGLPGVLPAGRPGDPQGDDDWFCTDWMDTSRAQDVLAFQRHSLPELIAEVRAQFAYRRPLLSIVAPAARRYLARRAPYRDAAGDYADPWGTIRRLWGDPAPDTASG